MTKTKLYRKTFLLTDTQVQIMDAIKDKLGLVSMTEVVRNALNVYAKSIYKYGATPLMADTDTDSSSSSSSVQLKSDICTIVLGGKINTDTRGRQSCIFTQYRMKESEDVECELPLSQVNLTLAETSLFYPTQELVYKKRPNVAKKFEKRG